MRKILWWVLVLLISMSLISVFSLSGCRKEALPAEEEVVEEVTEEVVEEAPAEEEVAEEEEVSGAVTIWLWDPYASGWQQADYPLYEKYPDITLDITTIDWPDNNTKFISAAAAGEGLPDIMAQVVPLAYPYASIGGLVDLTENVEPYKDKVPEWAWDLSSYEGKIYTVPFGGGPSVLFYRTDIFEDVGIDIESIETWQDWFDAGKEIYEATDGKTKLLCASASGVADWAGESIALQIMQQTGSGIYNKDGNIIVNNQTNVKILEFLKEVVDSGICLEEVYWSPANYSAMEDGTVATVPQACWMGGYLKTIAPASEGKWGVTYLPAWEEGGSRYSNNGGSFLAITSQCKNPELAWKVIESALLTKEGTLFDFVNYDNWPLLKETWDDPVMEEPDPFYNNQKIRKIYAEVANNVEATYFGPNWPEAYTIVQQVATDYFNGLISVEECLEQIEERLGNI